MDDLAISKVVTILTMIPELLLSLLGFTGGVISEGENTFTVDEKFDLLTEAETVSGIPMYCVMEVYILIRSGLDI